MEALLTYLLKSAAVLGIFFLVYQLLLRNDTHFQVNRRFLLTGIPAAIGLPAISFTRIIPLESTRLPRELLAAGGDYTPGPLPSLDWWQLAGVVYLFGLSFFLFRFLLQLTSLLRLLHSGSHQRENRYSMVTSEKQLAPFSFFHYIVYNPALHSEEELQIILRHEKIHASQWHSADVLLANLSTVLLWFNPFSWGYKNNLVQNLEYIADHDTVAAEVPVKTYQQSLVNIALANYQPVLANNFYQSFIKKRIIMLNKKPTHQLSILKLGAVIPFLCAFMFFFQVNLQAQASSDAKETDQESLRITLNPKQEQDQQKQEEAPLYILDGEVLPKNFDLNNINPNDIATVDVLKGDGATQIYGDKGKNGVILISLKKEISEKQFHKNQQDAAGLAAKPNTLYVVDGKLMDAEFNSSNLDPETIQTINILKGKAALDKYGAKGSEGVIEIRLKKQ